MAIKSETISFSADPGRSRAVNKITLISWLASGRARAQAKRGSRGGGIGGALDFMNFLTGAHARADEKRLRARARRLYRARLPPGFLPALPASPPFHPARSALWGDALRRCAREPGITGVSTGRTGIRQTSGFFPILRRREKLRLEPRPRAAELCRRRLYIRLVPRWIVVRTRASPSCNTKLQQTIAF